MRLIDADNAWGIGILQDWYIHSVNPDDIPQWTDEHIEELCEDFYVIPKETTKYDIDCNLDRLKELTQADKEGRCLIFPAGFEFENGIYVLCGGISKVSDGKKDYTIKSNKAYFLIKGEEKHIFVSIANMPEDTLKYYEKTLEGLK